MLDKIFTFVKNHTMASIIFYPYKPKGNSKVYVRCTLKRGMDFRLSTGLTIQEASLWQDGFPKSRAGAEYRTLEKKLRELKSHIEDCLIEVEQSQELSSNDLNSRWFKNVILSFFNEAPVEESNLLIPFTKKFIHELTNKTYLKKGRKEKYTQNTIDKYKYFLKNLEDYQTHLNKKIKINDVNSKFADKFADYLKTKKSQSINTIGRELKRLKTIIKDADFSGIAIDKSYNHIKGFEDETIVNFLTFDEIETIINTNMPDSNHEIAKDWLIIGCYTGQRISDLYRMEKSMLKNINGMNFIELKQFKTKKLVTIPIHYKVNDVLKKYNGDFPPNLNSKEVSNRTNLSKLMKKVCEIAKINSIERGRYNGVLGFYPKFQLIQNHSCRRAFCSNFYGLEGWTTPMIMAISGHETERNFLRYIDREDNSLSIQAAQNFKEMERKDNFEKEKQILRKA